MVKILRLDHSRHRKWYVDKGECLRERPGQQYGYLSTNKNYKNFILTVQFKQEANGNSGVFFRSSIDGVKISGWQVEVAPMNAHTGGIYESYGRGWLVQPNRARKIPERSQLEYDEDLCEGDSVTTWLNDHMMVTIKDEKIGRA